MLDPKIWQRFSVVLCALGGLGFFSPEGSAYARPSSIALQLRSEKQIAVGPSCRSQTGDLICLGLRYVVYEDDQGRALLTPSEVIKNLRAINQSWSSCGIQFQVDEYWSIFPEKMGLNLFPANESELPEIRNAFLSDSQLLVVTTQSWNRDGSLGHTAANAWTSLPGEVPYGVVMEDSVGAFPNLIAHELGHYLNLLHVEDQQNLMNPVIYTDSFALDSQQCEEARGAAHQFWKKMMS
ncbi:MAG: matrixin family metalloprotease [Bdellovibrionia bacterium]